MWLNWPRRECFVRNGSGCIEHGGIITPCCWLLIANDIHCFFWPPCCASSVHNGITADILLQPVHQHMNFVLFTLTQFGSMGRQYESYLYSHTQIYLSGSRTCSKAVRPSTWPALLKATMIVFISCSVEPRIFSALITYWRVRINITLVETDNSTPVNDRVFLKSFNLFSQWECQWRLIILLRVDWGLQMYLCSC